MAELRPLMMRANRSLGAALVEHSLIPVEVLEDATERLLEITSSADTEESISLLHVLINEKQALTEQHLLHYIVEEQGLGLIDLSNYDQPTDIRQKLDLGVSWATWTIPFDQEDGTHFLASAYYLSPAVRSYWEAALGENIIWYATSIDNIDSFLKRLKTERDAIAAATSTAAR